MLREEAKSWRGRSGAVVWCGGVGVGCQGEVRVVRGGVDEVVVW